MKTSRQPSADGAKGLFYRDADYRLWEASATLPLSGLLHVNVYHNSLLIGLSASQLPWTNDLGHVTSVFSQSAPSFSAAPNLLASAKGATDKCGKEERATGRHAVLTTQLPCDPQGVYSAALRGIFCTKAFRLADSFANHFTRTGTVGYCLSVLRLPALDTCRCGDFAAANDPHTSKTRLRTVC